MIIRITDDAEREITEPICLNDDQISKLTSLAKFRRVSLEKLLRDMITNCCDGIRDDRRRETASLSSLLSPETQSNESKPQRVQSKRVFTALDDYKRMQKTHRSSWGDLYASDIYTLWDICGNDQYRLTGKSFEFGFVTGYHAAKREQKKTGSSTRNKAQAG